MTETYLMETLPPVVEDIPSRALQVVTDAASLEQSLLAWSEQRKVLTRFIKQHLVEGSDYGKIHVAKSCDHRYDCTNPKHFSKDCLFKAGSEKFLGLLRLKPTFRKDEETWDMLGRPAGVICLVCTLVTVQGEVVGEGRGVRDSQKDSNDYNKSIKMAAKSAQMDAILRTGCLSDVFTQDLDDWPTEEKKDDKEEHVGNWRTGDLPLPPSPHTTQTANGTFPVAAPASPKKTDTSQSVWRETLRVQLPILEADWTEHLGVKSLHTLEGLKAAIRQTHHDACYSDSQGLALADAALQWVDKLEDMTQGPGKPVVGMEPGDL